MDKKYLDKSIALDSEIAPEPNRDVLRAIEQMAQAERADPKIAVTDSLPIQYVIRAVPK